jgi:hypothetical protein
MQIPRSVSEDRAMATRSSLGMSDGQVAGVACARLE